MAGGLKTSAQLPFADPAKNGRKLTLETDSSAGLDPPEGASYVRVFPSYAEAKVTAVLGSVGRVGSQIPNVVDEWVTFSGSDSAALRYPPTGDVSLSQGKFFGASKVAYVYDEDNNCVLLDSVAHGVVRVQYTAMFDRWIVHHTGDAGTAPETQTEGGTQQDTAQKNYDPAFIVATAATYDMVSMEVSGPASKKKKKDTSPNSLNSTIQFSRYEPVGIKIEEDAAIPPGIYPYYFNATNTPLGFTLQTQTVMLGGQAITLYCGCRIRVYPRVSVQLIGVNCAVGSSPIGSDSKPVVQAVTFSGTSSQGLEYPPSSSISIAGASANAVSTFGVNVGVGFRKGGDWVNEVTWDSENTFRLTPGARTVRADEIVCTTSMGNNTIPCYTFCQVQYTSDYYLYDVLFNWDTKLGWFAPAMVCAIGPNGMLGSKELSPPGKGGVL